MHEPRATTREPLPYRAPAWLPGAHIQTIYAALFAPRPRVNYQREQWETPDGDFIDVDWLIQDRESRIADRAFASSILDPECSIPSARPLVALFHGLEGGSRSHYAAALMSAVASLNWHGVVIHFRGCGGTPNRLPRAYHSGDSAELDWIVRRLRNLVPKAPLFAVGVSLGGNVLLKWLGEQGEAAANVVSAASAVCAPVDLTAAGDALGRGFNLFYTQNFLLTLKRKTRAKLALYPALCDSVRMLRARTMHEFDDAVTAPLHGFRDTDDYWTRASSKPLLRAITVPTLMINTRNDPFLPAHALPGPHELSAAVTADFFDEGGHVGFVTGPFPGRLDWLPARILAFFAGRTGAAASGPTA
jgi:predicted alpha/beta-fold hydrolase